MYATSHVRNEGFARLRFASVTMLIGLLIVVFLESAVTAQDSDDTCSSMLVDMISQTGLDLQTSAPALGCRQSDDGTWYMPRISTTSEEALTQQLNPDGAILLAAVDRMSMDDAFGNSLRFTREDSNVHVPGIGGVVSSTDLSNNGIGAGPQWLNNVRNSYNQSMTVYLTRTVGSESDLVFYMEWFMARRDATLMAITGQMNPLAATAFLDTFGFQQFPWPWQLADQAAIAAHMGHGPLDFSPEYPLAPNPTPLSETGSAESGASVQQASLGPIFSPAELTAAPGDEVNLAVALPPTTFGGGFFLTISLPVGVELLRLPECEPVAACQSAAIASEVISEESGSTEVKISGLILGGDNPASFHLSLRISEEAPTGEWLQVFAGISFMSSSAPANVPTGASMAIEIEEPAGVN